MRSLKMSRFKVCLEACVDDLMMMASYSLAQIQGGQNLHIHWGGLRVRESVQDA